MTEKKASEILEEMNSKLDTILKFVANIDLNYKLISSKLNNTAQFVPHDIVSRPSQFVIPPDHPKPAQESMQFIEVQDQKIDSDRKVTVMQKVHYPNDKPVALAKIKIFDQSKKEIKETKTNHIGKWTAVLDPGNYHIHITKAEVADKPKIDHYFNITVDPQNGPLELKLVK